MKSYKKMLPSLAELELVSSKIKGIRNRQGEYLRKIHYGCFLLCSQAGLRISEAVKFDLSAKNKQDLYRISKPKGKKERLVYISPQVVSELKKHNWQPNQTNRFAFYHFLKKVKREINISPKIELSPHTFRRAFTTYHANSGMPLPLLQKLLGHSSIKTTASYWRNIYSDNDNGEDDATNILAGKKWLENRRKEPSQPPSENFPKQLAKNPKPDIIRNKPTITAEKPTKQDNSLIPIKIEEKSVITNYQPKPPISEIPLKPQEKFISKKIEISEQLRVITNQREQPTTNEEVLLTKIQQLEEQLAQVQGEKQSFAELLNKSEKENSNLKVLVKTEKQRADNYKNQLKIITKSLYQWQKIKHYQQLEKEQKNLAQVEQPLPFKPSK